MSRHLVLSLFLCATLSAATIAEKTAGLTKLEGYFPLYWDAKAGKMFLEIPALEMEFLYYSSLPSGLGSNDVGLDRGQIGGTHLVQFERNGPKVLLLENNSHFRAISDNQAEARAVTEAFARSAIFGFTVEAESDGRILVDATNFFLRDAHGVIETLKQTRQGTYKLELGRSMFYLDRTKGFPRNSEVEVTLTFLGDAPGNQVKAVTPSADSITLREHHSLVALPEPGYKPRSHDPRAGFFGISYFDYATPFTQPIAQRFIARHRLEKKDPAPALSDPVKPIIYYLDPGVPEPIRSALREGASWWKDAFTAAGFSNAFEVRILPPGADPMDVRYNMIQWVHRSTRGWSYGSSITDPRTGEIIKGHVTLGSLRIRQDYLIAEGLLAPYDSGVTESAQGREMALARIRQLAAHEVGHTLGITHNFAASANKNASVMDYPHPFIELTQQGNPQLANAYPVGIGEWDKVAISYGYAQFSNPETEAIGLKQILNDSFKKGLEFISDTDARPEGGAHPRAHLWDSGPDAVAELGRIMKIRTRALERFGANTIREGAPWSTLGDALVPIYLLHRYQTEAVAKLVGGVDYTYALKGDGQKITEIIAPEIQRRAIASLLNTIRPESLTLNERLVSLIPPHAFGFGPTRESFRGASGLVFDANAPAEAAANLTIGLLLHPQRANRLVEQHARNAKSPDFAEIVDKLIEATWKSATVTGLSGSTQQTVCFALLHRLMALAGNDSAAPTVRAQAYLKLEQLRDYARFMTGPRLALGRYAVRQIDKFQTDPKQVTLTFQEIPPGQPIGCEDLHME